MVILEDGQRVKLLPHLLCFIIGYLAGTGDLASVLIG
jgi:hypothetical protein